MSPSSAVLPAPTDKKPRRVGRPPTQSAGEVEARILEAAARVFVDRGFDGASIELIAETAQAGKPTIYARFPDKEALFEAAFLRKLAFRNARLETHKPLGESAEERLTRIGVALIEESLADDFIGLCRLAISEARRRPELSSGLIKQCRERGAHSVARLLLDGLVCGAWRDENDPLATKAGRFFAELVLVPYIVRALAMEDAESLHEEIELHVRERVKFFLAALRNGGLD
jgi:AcrR family transcriptional regulator